MPLWICLQEKSPRSLRDVAEKRALSARRLFFVNKSKVASKCRREAAAFTVRCLDNSLSALPPWRRAAVPRQRRRELEAVEAAALLAAARLWMVVEI